MKLPVEIFDAICNSKVSIAYLTNHLNDCIGRQERNVAWLYCYCRATFMIEMDGSQHEEIEHATEMTDCGQCVWD